MSALVGILLGVAAKVGAPIVRKILADKVGGATGDLGGVIVDAIAAKAGVPADQLSTVPAPELEAAVAAVEQDTPDIIAAWNAQQQETNRLMLAEMQKETPFGWLWRPAGMWLMLACIAWYVMVVPLLNTILGAAGATARIVQGVTFSDFIPVFTVFVGLYMGGNTLIRSFKRGA